jgi:hypothetical protein
MTTKEYYDKHLKKDGEGKCIVCNNSTTFYSYKRGYAEFCSIECLNSSEEMSRRVSTGKKDLNYEEINEKIKKTMMERYGVEHSMDSKEIREKIENTNIERYGVKNVCRLPHVVEASRLAISTNFEEINKRRGESIKASSKEANEKRKKTVFSKYGVESISKVKEFVKKARKTICEKYGFRTEEEFNEFEKYRKEVRRVTIINKQNIIKNSRCYYSNLIMDYNEKIRNNKFQATIDHKISIIYGFRNNIDPKIIGGLDNLCYCCRFVNSIKNFRCESEFKVCKKYLKLIERIQSGEFNTRV